MELKNKRVLVVGLAKTGLAVARFLVQQGARVVANDAKLMEQLREGLRELDGLCLEIITGEHPPSLFEEAELVVVSPGVPRDLPVLKLARAAGAEILSEMELAFRFVDVPLLAVSGTNGKTTTVSLLGEMMKRHFAPGNIQAGEQVFVGGNIGTPLIELPRSRARVKAAVVEVSSFQLEFIRDFRAAVGVMMNVTHDHLDRYAGLDDYAAVKAELFRNQRPEDLAVLNAEDPYTRQMAEKTRGRVFWFSLEKHKGPGIYHAGQELIYHDDAGREEHLSLTRFKLHGVHNLMNVMAASCAALGFGARPEAVQEVIDTFRGLPHRLEFIRELEGVKYYNDSKATNPGAVIQSLRSFAEPVILLLAGQTKGCPLTPLLPEIKERVKVVLAFGEIQDQARQELRHAGRIEFRQTMSEALERAREVASPGDVVLLAPAGASFDQFKDYKDRGEQFRALVERW